MTRDHIWPTSSRLGAVEAARRSGALTAAVLPESATTASGCSQRQVSEQLEHALHAIAQLDTGRLGASQNSLPRPSGPWVPLCMSMVE